jgi:predicted transglutaminase-like cysteine proteinase
MFCAMTAFGAAIATPADAAGLRPEDTRLARMSFDADPLTEAFGARPVMPLDVAHSTKWTDVLRRQESPETVTVPCRDTSAEQCFETFWSDAVAAMKSLSRAEKVRYVNDLINKMGYWSDWDVYREADHWATPAEMFAMGGGDCEDFALFKYFLLRAAGVPAEDMRLTLVAYQDQAHMVALVMVDGEPIVMDCLVMKATPPEQLAQYQAVYSVGETGAWLLAKDDQRTFVQASR